jgi:predicted Zn-dependent protease
LAFGLAGCAKNYVTHHRQFKLISKNTEIEIGKKAKAQIVKEYGSYHDLDWEIYLDQVGQRIAKASDRKDLSYDFTILDTDILNAFAVPGGFVFVTRGLLMECADEAELAIVLGHEITHVAAWHGIEQLQRAGLLSTLTALGIVGGAALGAGDAAIALGQAASVYENLYLLGYGRKNEVEADRYGILYAARAGYDPEAAITFFERLDKIEKEEQAAQRISPYWRTHPLTTERLKKGTRWIAQVPNRETALTFNRDKYQAMVARLPHTEPAERGVVENRVYRNIPFGIRLDVPEGWSMDNSRAQTLVTMTGPAPEVRGHLQRFRLTQEMGVQEFAKQVARQWGVQEAVTREVDYPAGHGLLWQYGGDYMRYRTLLIVRGQAGYALMCQAPAEQYLQYLVDCEKIMRSLVIQ